MIYLVVSGLFGLVWYHLFDSISVSAGSFFATSLFIPRIALITAGSVLTALIFKPLICSHWLVSLCVAVIIPPLLVAMMVFVVYLTADQSRYADFLRYQDYIEGGLPAGGGAFSVVLGSVADICAASWHMLALTGLLYVFTLRFIGKRSRMFSRG